jgi:hypothetical protein
MGIALARAGLLASRTRLLLALIGGAVAIVLAHGAFERPAHADVALLGGTEVCGALPVGLTTWSALGAPYTICTQGVTVPLASVLTLDGTHGGFTVQAAGSGGLTVDGGALGTVGTSATSRVTFTSALANPSQNSWAGITAGEPQQPTASQLRLSYVSIRYAYAGVSALNTPPVTLDQLSIDASSVAVRGINADVSLTDSTATNLGHAFLGTAATSGWFATHSGTWMMAFMHSGPRSV